MILFPHIVALYIIKKMQNNYLLIFTIFYLNNVSAENITKIIKSNNEELILRLNTNPKTIADLKPFNIFIGLPDKRYPTLEVNTIFTKELPPGLISPAENYKYKWIGIQNLDGLIVGTLSVSPITGDSNYSSEISVKVKFNNRPNRTQTNKNHLILSQKVINWSVAKNWMNLKVQKRMSKKQMLRGNYLKFSLKNDGVYFISYNQIKSLYPTIDDINPKKIKLYIDGNHGRSINFIINGDVQPNSIEIPIFIKGEDDESFDSNDKIIFYGNGPSGFDNNSEGVIWNQNLYFNDSNYYLSLGDSDNTDGKRIVDELNTPSNLITIDYGIKFLHFETDIFNPNASGLQWYENSIQSNNSKIITLDLNNINSDIDFNIKTSLKGNSISTASASHQIGLFMNDPYLNQIQNTTSWYGFTKRNIYSKIPLEYVGEGSNNLYIKNISNDLNSNPYFDNVSLDFGIYINDNYCNFYSPIYNQNIRFIMQNELNDNSRIWDITFLESIKSINPLTVTSFNTFGYEERFSNIIIFQDVIAQSVDNLIYVGEKSFNKLKNDYLTAQYIIIGPEEYREDCHPLLELRSPAIYASLENIYEEFSQSNRDPMAIKYFLQWALENYNDPKTYAALLLGDAGYDYRNITGSSSIIIPTVQVEGFRNYASDDRLSTIYGSMPSIATGRIPVKNKQDVLNFINKILKIETEKNFGTWRTQITLIADDAARPEPNHGGISTGKSHTLNSENLYNIIPNFLNTKKIYLINYPEVNEASAYGVIKPEATDDLIKTIASGTSIINYIGHGSAKQLAQEKILDLERGDINLIESENMPPLWIVGTCSFGHFDDPLNESFAEALIKSELAGASAVISTSRPITVTGNERYTSDLFKAMFPDGRVSGLPIGVILQSIKNGSSESEYFHLFGDPAMKLNIPKNILSINDINLDTLRTLTTIDINIEENDYISNGTGTIILNDSPTLVTREYSISSTIQQLSFVNPGFTLSKSNFSFEGEINTKIIIPKDYSYSNEPNGILKLYINNDFDDAVGIIKNILIVEGNNIEDNDGPIISFENAHGRLLGYGEHINKNDDLIIRIKDSIGINIANEIGHEIIFKNLETNQEINLTDTFIYDQNQTNSGTINIGKLVNNKNNIEVKAWDNANNPSENTILLYLSRDNNIEVYNIYNFPNPFSKKTKFTFELSKQSIISISIYTLSGRKIKHLAAKDLGAGFQSIFFDGKNEFGVEIPNGVYIYKLKAESKNSKKIVFGRFAKIR